MAIKRKFPAKTATVFCSGGCRAKRDEKDELLCTYGCIGCGACVEACKFDAIHINEFGCAEVDEEKCIGCGACARKCPREPSRICGSDWKPQPQGLKLVVIYCTSKSEEIPTTEGRTPFGSN